MQVIIAALLGLVAWAIAKVALLRRGVSSGYHGRHRRPGGIERRLIGEMDTDGGIEYRDRGRHTSAGRAGLAARLIPVTAAAATALLVTGLSGFVDSDGPVDESSGLDASPATTSAPAGETSTQGPPSSVTTATTTLSTSIVVASGNNATVRGMFGHDGSASGFDSIRAASFNSVLVGATREQLDELQAAGLGGVVWLGEYDRTSPCDFEFSDEQVTADVTAIAGHPAIAAYFLADEPSIARAESCPSAPEDIRRRSELVKSLDPSKPTMVSLTTWDGVETFPYSYWLGTADIFGLVVYPCFQGECDFTLIDQAVSVADSVGLGEYWAIIQDFSDSWYDLPTADQVNEQFARWSGSNMTGYLVFAAGGFSCCQTSDFDSNPDKAAVLRAWNQS